MIVKSFLLKQDNIENIVALCDDQTLAVVRPEKKVEKLFRDAVRMAIVEKRPADNQFKEIESYFDAFASSAEYREKVEETLRTVSAYLGEGMYVQASLQSIEDYVLAKCARLCAEAVGTRTGGKFIDGTVLVVCHQEGGRTIIDWTLSRAEIESRCKGHSRVIVPGGYGRLDSGYVVRIGRGGSHVMVSLIASALGADRIEFYTETDGIQGIAAMTYDEAAHYCASADTPFPSASLWPAKSSEIPIYVKNIYKPELKGTIISSAGNTEIERRFSGIICDDGLSLITVYGTGLLGQVGMSSAVFSTLASIGVNIRFISQSSSEYSISFAVLSEDKDKAVDAIGKLVVSNPQFPLDDVMILEKPAGIVTVYGDKMKNIPGVSGKVYSAVGDAGINIIASAQGGEELSISLVLAPEDLAKAAEALSKI